MRGSERNYFFCCSRSRDRRAGQIIPQRSATSMSSSGTTADTAEKPEDHVSPARAQQTKVYCRQGPTCRPRGHSKPRSTADKVALFNNQHLTLRPLLTSRGKAKPGTRVGESVPAASDEGARRPAA